MWKWVAAIGCLMTGCPGDFDGQLFDVGLEAAGPVKLDKQIQVLGLDRGGQQDSVLDRDRSGGPEASACTPESETTTCSPLTSAECEQGAACYIVRGQYLDCVCPPGTATHGQPCNTATDCVPGLTCYSASGGPPGSCSILCDCTAVTSCLPLTGFAPLGLCDLLP